MIHTLAIRSCIVVCTVLVCAVSAFASTPTREHSTPQDSFLTVQVTSVNELVYEICSNSKISSRYGKLYHVAPSNVATYFKHNLQITRLKHDYAGTVYCVKPGTGAIYPTHQVLKAGSRVFSLANGTPILKWECGNPLNSSLPAVLAHKLGKRAKAATVPNNQHLGTLPTKPLEETSNFLPPPSDVFVPTEQVLPYSGLLGPQPPVGGPADFSVPIGGAGGGGLSPALLLGALPLFYHSSSSSSGGAAPAPEVSTSIAWLLGGGVIALSLLKMKKKTKLSKEQ